MSSPRPSTEQAHKQQPVELSANENVSSKEESAGLVPNEDDNKKTASVTEAPVEVQSPPLTSSLHSRNSASSAVESAYLRQASILGWSRLLLAIIVTAVACSIVGCSSHVLQSYNATHFTSEWFLPLWPINIDIRPTIATVAPAAIAAGGALIYIAYAIVPSPRSQTMVQNMTFAGISALGFIVSLFSVIYSQVVTYDIDADSRETLLTWTCKLYDGAKSFHNDATTLKLPSDSTALLPEGFKQLCMESRVSKWMMVALLVVEILCVAVAAVGVFADRRINKIRKEKYQNEKLTSHFDS